MQNPFFYGVGGTLSADIAVPDHDQEVAFYTQILTTGDQPLWRNEGPLLEHAADPKTRVGKS